jgi:hypothetical protein
MVPPSSVCAAAHLTTLSEFWGPPLSQPLTNSWDIFELRKEVAVSNIIEHHVKCLPAFVDTALAACCTRSISTDFFGLRTWIV